MLTSASVRESVVVIGTYTDTKSSVASFDMWSSALLFSCSDMVGTAVLETEIDLCLLCPRMPLKVLRCTPSTLRSHDIDTAHALASA